MHSQSISSSFRRCNNKCTGVPSGFIYITRVLAAFPRTPLIRNKYGPPADDYILMRKHAPPLYIPPPTAPLSVSLLISFGLPQKGRCNAEGGRARGKWVACVISPTEEVICVCASAGAHCGFEMLGRVIFQCFV